MPVASIVVNTYERPEPLSRCIEAVSRQKRIDEAEVIVVDDGSAGDFRAIERNWTPKLNFRYVKIRHAGRAAARNRGVREASGRRVLFLGDDIQARPGWLERHLASGRDDPKIAVLGPCPLDFSRPEWKRTSPPFRRWADPVDYSLIRSPEDAGFEFFLTGNLSMDRDMFLELGGFDERYEHYGWEDIDLGYRFYRAGGRVVFDERARALHCHPPMTRADLWRREFAMGITAWQFWNKWRDDEIKFLKFWNDDRGAGPEWRRRLGDWAAALLDRAAPDSALNRRLYRRLVFSWRYAGVAEGRRLHGGER